MKIIEHDPWLEPFAGIINQRKQRIDQREKELTLNLDGLDAFATGHLYFGLQRMPDGWVLREWAPNADSIHLVGDFNDWRSEDAYAFTQNNMGHWQLEIPRDALHHTDQYKLRITWPGGGGDRIPAWTRRVVQQEDTKLFNAQVWSPETPYVWKHAYPDLSRIQPLVYEAHVGMATEKHNVGTFREFREEILPRVVKAGYNTLQLMAIQEHPYYGSFGYHVSNFFAVSSRFGTPTELKELVDAAHGEGLAVIMDLVHSHAVKNELEGPGNYAGDPHQFFQKGDRRNHVAWDSLCFDYGKNEVIHFLLSNVHYWLTEFHFDGFRFDGITSMLYLDHGLSRDFTSYELYFDGGQDEDAITYMGLANRLIQKVKPGGISIAEDMSGYPGLAAPVEWGGIGFSHRLAMGIPDYWIKTIKERSDENWNMGELYHELTSKREEEQTIGYAESHDQALVGDKTIIFRLMDQEMYWHMDKQSESLVIDRGMALHKMIRFITAATSGNGYLTFMGNEFGHPEWIDFPREGNNWSYHYARRQWSLMDNPALRYHFLGDFDRTMIRFIDKNRLLTDPCQPVKTDQQDLLIAFTRKGFLFVFNFHPHSSYTDYGLAVDAGKYQVVFTTDDAVFGGFERVDRSVVHRSIPERSFGLKHRLNLYLPARTGMVLKKIPIPSVR